MLKILSIVGILRYRQYAGRRNAMSHYEAPNLEVKDMEAHKIYGVDETTLPIIRKKGVDMQLRPVFEITFIGKEKP
jgi:hypothetical protein